MTAVANSGVRKTASKNTSAKAAPRRVTKKAAKAKGAKKTASRKGAADSAPAKGASKQAAKSNRKNKYGPLASEDVREEMHEMKRGELRIGRSGKKVTNPKQAIAIGLAKARREGAKVPPNPNKDR